MGFWRSVANMAEGAMNQLETHNVRAQELTNEYQSESDDFLKRKLKSGDVAQKVAAAKVLKSRGYTGQA